MLQPQELVMSRPQKKYDPNQDQEQEQEQAQANLQAQLQGQGQGQLQGQGQGQLQFAVQSLESSSENENENGNSNGNSNENSNENEVENDVDNSLDNRVDNSLDNDVDNSLENCVNNKIENEIENEVNVAVNVDVDLGIDADSLSNPVIDLHHFDTQGSVVMPDVVNQTLNGNGNQFNIDQVNNLVDNDTNTSTASYSGGGGGSWWDPGASFSMEATIDGGESSLTAGDIGARANVSSHADAAINQSAFDQNITQGANIQFNSITMQVAGNDLTDSHDNT
jgi:hypothetical protein